MKRKEDVIEKLSQLFEQIKKHSVGLSNFEFFVGATSNPIKVTIERKNRVGARYIFREINNFLREGAMPYQSIEIRKRILRDSGIDIFEGLRKDLKNVELIVRRGHIRNLAEYAIIDGAMNAIGGLSEPDAKAEASILSDLLFDYDRRNPDGILIYSPN